MQGWPGVDWLHIWRMNLCLLTGIQKQTLSTSGWIWYKTHKSDGEAELERMFNIDRQVDRSIWDMQGCSQGLIHDGELEFKLHIYPMCAFTCPAQTLLQGAAYLTFHPNEVLLESCSMVYLRFQVFLLGIEPRPGQTFSGVLSPLDQPPRCHKEDGILCLNNRKTGKNESAQLHPYTSWKGVTSSVILCCIMGLHASQEVEKGLCKIWDVTTFAQWKYPILDTYISYMELFAHKSDRQ